MNQRIVLPWFRSQTQHPPAAVCDRCQSAATNGINEILSELGRADRQLSGRATQFRPPFLLDRLWQNGPDPATINLQHVPPDPSCPSHSSRPPAHAARPTGAV